MMIDHKIILLNGPPSSGKDTAARYICLHFNARHHKFSRPLRAAMQEFFGFTPETIKVVEAHKDERKVALFNDLTWREVLISFSEDWAKPTFGNDIFGKIALGQLLRATGTDITVFSDCGFRSEVEVIVDRVGVDNCLVIQLSRDGCTFEGDSRSYLELSDIGVTTVELHNNLPLSPTPTTPITYEMQICAAVRKWLGVEQE